MNKKQIHIIHVPQRIISWGERMTAIRLAQTQRIKDSRIQKQNTRRLRKEALSKPDNL